MLFNAPLNQIFQSGFFYLPPLYLAWWNLCFPTNPINILDSPFVLQSSQNIQGTPHAASPRKKNLDLHLAKLGYLINHFIHII